MKKYISLFAFAAIAVMSSCQKEASFEQAGTRTITVGASQENTKLVLKNGQDVKFVAKDKLIGFDTNDAKYISEESKSQSESVEFKFTDWSGTAAPAYFAFNNSTTIKVNTDAQISGDDIELTVPYKQEVYDTNSFARYGAVLVGKAVENEGSYSSTMKNVCGYVRVAFDNFDGIHKVSMKSSEGTAISGVIHVSKSSVDSGTPEAVSVTGEGIDSVYITPINSGNARGIGSEGNECFKMKDEAVFYFAVIPGTFTPVITFTDTLGNESVKTATKAITVTRAGIYDLKTVDAKLDFEHPVVDENVEISLDFMEGSAFNWDLTPACPAIKDTGTLETSFGEVYTFNYGKYPVPFTIQKGEKYTDTKSKTYFAGYYNYGTGLKFNSLKDWIQLPVIPGKQISEVTVAHANSTAKTVKVIYGDTEQSQSIAATGSYTFTGINYDGECKVYRSSGVGIVYTQIKAKYVPVASVPQTVVVGFAAGETPSKAGLAASNAEKMNKPFILNGYMFTPSEGLDCYWRSSSTDLFLTSSTGSLKLPKLMGYRLSRVYMESSQGTAKNWKVRVGTSDENLKTLASFTLSSTSPATIAVSDPYSSDNEYYLTTYNTGVSISALQLTYEKLK